MDPSYYDNCYNIIDIKQSTIVAKALYELEGGDNLKQLQNNQERLIQIDNFYISKYRAQTYVLQQIVFFCCLGLIGAIFYNKQIISQLVFNMYLLILLIVLLYYTGYSIYDIFLRDSHNFDEYDYTFINKPSFQNPDKITGSLNVKFSNISSCY